MRFWRDKICSRDFDETDTFLSAVLSLSLTGVTGVLLPSFVILLRGKLCLLPIMEAKYVV